MLTCSSCWHCWRLCLGLLVALFCFVCCFIVLLLCECFFLQASGRVAGGSGEHWHLFQVDLQLQRRCGVTPTFEILVSLVCVCEVGLYWAVGSVLFWLAGICIQKTSSKAKENLNPMHRCTLISKRQVCSRKVAVLENKCTDRKDCTLFCHSTLDKRCCLLS